MFDKIKWKIGKKKHKAVKEKEQALKVLLDDKKLPILVIDKSWYDVKIIIENDKIIEKEKVVLELVKERASLNQALKEKDGIKRGLMKKILEASEALDKGNKSKEIELETLHQALTRLNEEVPKHEAKLEEVETLLTKSNRELTEEAVALSYTYMEEYKEESQKLEEEIDELRAQLLEKTNMKKSYNTKMTTLYHYLHNMVGYKHIDKIDERLGDRDQ